MNKDELKCPYCGYESDKSNFPDYFYPGCPYPEQFKRLIEIQKAGFNIVTCGMCGEPFIQKLEGRE